MSQAPYSRAAAARPKWFGISRRSFGPLSTRTPNLSPIICGPPSQSPGMITRSAPSVGCISRLRAIHSVVISAATVILSTVTSYANGGAISLSTRRSAGSASRPVTNSTRRGAASLPASFITARGPTPGVGALHLTPTDSWAPASSPRVAAQYELIRRALERAARRRPPQRDLLDAAGWREGLVRDHTGAEGRPLDHHTPPRHSEIGMVVRRLRAVADGVDEHERRRPTIGLVDASDPAVFEVPPGQLSQALGDLRFVVRWLLLRHGTLRSSHHHAATHEDRLSGEERRGRRCEEHGSTRDVVGRAPPPERRGFCDRAAHVPIQAGAERRLDPTGREHVHAHARRDRPRERLAEGEDSALHRCIDLRVQSRHAGEDVVPAHVDDDAALLLRAEHLRGMPRGENRAAKIHREHAVQLLHRRE